MKFSERWRIAGIISSEVRFQGYLEMNPTNLSRVKENPERIAKAIKSNSRFNTFITTFLVVTLAVVTGAMSIFDVEVGSAQTRLAVGLSVFLVLCFVLLIFLNLSVTTGFFAADVMKFPGSLPLSNRELDELSLLAFARVFIAPTILILTVFPGMILLFIGPGPALAALIGCAATTSLSIGALTKLAIWFQRKSHEVTDSPVSTIVRVSASLGLAIGMVTMFSMGIWLPSVIHLISDLSTGLGSQGSSLLAILFPFSFGFLASTIQFGLALPVDTMLGAIGASIAYALLAIYAYQSTGTALRATTVGGISVKRTLETREVALSVVSPLKAVVRKDLKLATRNIGSSFIFIIPLFLLLFNYPMMAGWSTSGPLRSLTALIATEYGNFFAGITIISVLMFDTQGASIQVGLPLRTKKALDAKIAISMVPYIGSMVIISLLLTMFPLKSPWIPLIPLIQIPAGYTISLAVGAVTFWRMGGGRAVSINVTANPMMSFIAAAIGGGIGIIPLVGYGVTMILTGHHLASLGAQFLLMVLTLVLVKTQAVKLLKD